MLGHLSYPVRSMGLSRFESLWAERHGRFTVLMESFVIDVLLACQTVKAACQLLNISWDQAWNVMDRADNRGMLRKEAISSRLLGVDEKDFRKGNRYLTIVNDLDKSTVEFIAENRGKSSLEWFFKTRTPEQLRAIKGRALERCPPAVYIRG